MTKKDILIENDWSDEERRAYERYSVEFYLAVYNSDNDALFGHIMDISLGGMQLLSETSVAIGELFRFRIDAALQDGQKLMIELQVRNAWQTEDLNPGFFNAGFEFIDLPPSAMQGIEDITAEIIANM